MTGRRRNWGDSLLILTSLVAGAAVVAAQGATATVRIALLPQWVVTQHRGAVGPLQSALDGGVVDRTVFAWQRGAIQRQALVTKPVRLLAGSEAEALGGRGAFAPVAVRPSRGVAAWTEIEVASPSGRPDDALVLEIGGELNTIYQVLETLLVAGPDGSLSALALSSRAVVRAPGVPVVRAPFGQPLAASVMPAFFRTPGGVELLVARSPVETIVNGGLTPNGPADVAASPGAGQGDWREGDRVFVRVPLAALAGGAPAIVLGWKDRMLRPDPDGEFPSRASLGISPLH